MDIVYPHFPDEAYEVLYSPTHRWFYKKGMQWDDVIIFKLGDNSDVDATGHSHAMNGLLYLTDYFSVCPHTAFEDPSLASGAPKRASIEVKVIVIGWYQLANGKIEKNLKAWQSAEDLECFMVDCKWLINHRGNQGCE